MSRETQLLLEAAKLIEDKGLAEDSPAAQKVLNDIHQVLMDEQEHYRDFDDWLDEVRRANICDLMP